MFRRHGQRRQRILSESNCPSLGRYRGGVCGRPMEGDLVADAEWRRPPVTFFRRGGGTLHRPAHWGGHPASTPPLGAARLLRTLLPGSSAYQFFGTATVSCKRDFSTVPFESDVGVAGGSG